VWLGSDGEKARPAKERKEEDLIGTSIGTWIF
jgi:hypothetical protein